MGTGKRPVAVIARCRSCQGPIDGDGFCTTCGLAQASPEAPPELAANGNSHAVAAAPLVVDSAPSNHLSIVLEPASDRTTTRRVAGRVRPGATTSSHRSTRSGNRRRATGPAALPMVPLVDPAHLSFVDEVPENRRACRNERCRRKLTRTSGFCPSCGRAYSFVPSLRPGATIANRYEVRGAIGYGGLGWLYLARDIELGRWVVLKGVLDAADPHQAAVAVNERRFLAAVKHPAIVAIYDFISHGTQGFIVMEYINGKTLLTLRRERVDPLPVREAISAILSVLPAFDYLDQQGLAYCDFKPDNAMIEADAVKLIDLGSVRRVDDQLGDVFGTRGYSAPEADDQPTILSDLYSVARTLAVLIVNFDFQHHHEYSLPTPDQEPLFQQHESLYLWLLKATRREPSARFRSAEEMAAQLVGLLREVIGANESLAPFVSSHFGVGGLGGAELLDPAIVSLDLPAPRPDPSDPSLAALAEAVALPNLAERYRALELVEADYPHSPAVWCAWLEAALRHGDLERAAMTIAEIPPELASDWRPDWYEGCLALSRRDAVTAQAALGAVVSELPGEPIPKLALAAAHEQAGDLQRALQAYQLVANANPTMTSAVFGLARCHRMLGDTAAAGRAYERIPATSNHYVVAQLALCRTLLTSTADGTLSATRLVAAAAALDRIADRAVGLEAHLARASLLSDAAALVEGKLLSGSRPDLQILGEPLDQPARLRRAAERELRRCAQLATTPREHTIYIDAANSVRPMTWI